MRDGNRATPHANAVLIGEHPALEAIQRRLVDGEKLLAYLDDATVICRPERVRTVVTIIDEELARHAHVNIHCGKTQCGIVAELHRRAYQIGVCGGVTSSCQLNGKECGSRCANWILRFVRQQLEDKSAEQDLLFHRIPLMEDTQACWLLLLMCAATGELLVARSAP